MNIVDSYQTIEKKGEGFYKDKGSKFMAYTFNCSDEDKAKSIILELRKNNPNACHVCFAWRFGNNESNYKDRYSDDGEPNNSAGKPIFGQIIAFDITNVLVAVVRFYGGTNLGVGGLIKAYKEASKDAFENAIIVQKYIHDNFELLFNYEEMGSVMNLLKKHNVININQGFENEKAKISFEIRQSKTSHIIKNLTNLHKIEYKLLTN